ncbi:SNF2-related protein [Parachitinimonas caeni]|uniref:DEAD/DEAH box helicase family protein n=1 Tax=Parachitinimonas caeni TaxID=3031301 RepID=A0ABT7E386_9NEIS|nr:SNF2-related protein [Parachitinimonas caeni]MDK2126763.1 DEAD/DEAH box helicase family protein [Parachitinimonas caeni]
MQTIDLSTFVQEFGSGLLEAVRCQNPPIYDGQADPRRDALMDQLLRKPFPAQRDVVQAICRLLLDANQPAGIINGEMGCGKTLLGIAVAYLLHHAGLSRCLIIAPPHLVYKWRREIKATVANARVWILNGPDTLRKLLQLRAMRDKPDVPEFFVLGRVRMRMGFHWKPAFAIRQLHRLDEGKGSSLRVAACPHCGEVVATAEGFPLPALYASGELADKRSSCKRCQQPLWTLFRPQNAAEGLGQMVRKSLLQLPTIGDKTADRLLEVMGAEALADILEDNLYDFVNLMGADGEFVFSDSQAKRLERALANTEVSFGQGGYQASEFVKRQLPQGFFSLLIADEAHEYKNVDSAQGQAMAVLARKCRKTLLLTGTLMGGYADDLFVRREVA